MKFLALILPFATVAICQSTGAATTKGICSPAVTGSGNTINITTCGMTKKQVEDIAKLKMPDLNAASLEAAIQTVKGTARSMGLEVV